MIEDGELVGNLYQVPDKWWGFESVGRHNHPGACVGYENRGFKAVMLKGTDPKSRDYKYAEVLVEPDGSNKLKKTTSFSINPRLYSARKVGLLADVLIGELTEKDLRRMQNELRRQFGDPDEE